MANKKLDHHLNLIIVLIIYSALAIFSISYQHYHLGSDGISYISIAAKYANGDWWNAINGYWSPLYSWLIAPILIIIGYEHYYASYLTRLVSFIAGFFTIIGISRLCTTFNLNKSIKILVLVTSVPSILFFSVKFDTPDLLVLCLLVYYFSIIFNENYSNNSLNGVICGLLGGIGFLSKTYILPFFLVHFTFFNFLYYFKGFDINKNGVKKNLILGLIVFLAISSLWIATLNSKYGRLTIGTSTEYNHAVIGPEYPTHPVYFMGLIKPPNNSATSTWEEPSLVNLSDWSPFESWDYFEYQMALTSDNLFRFVIFIEYYSMLSLVIILLSLYFIYKPRIKKSDKNRLIYLIITMFIYSAGYLLIHVQDRYIYPVIILLMFCGFYLVNLTYDENKMSLKLKNVILALLMVSFLVAPTMELISYPNSDNSIFELSETLKNNYNIHGNIASNDNWGNTNEISFLLNSQYYSLPKNSTNLSGLEKELMANNINYYFVWGDSNDINLTNYKEITNGKIQGLKIYQYEKKI